jgi:hypothetical protein
MGSARTGMGKLVAEVTIADGWSWAGSPHRQNRSLNHFSFCYIVIAPWPEKQRRNEDGAQTPHKLTKYVLIPAVVKIDHTASGPTCRIRKTVRREFLWARYGESCVFRMANSITETLSETTAPERGKVGSDERSSDQSER